MFLLCILVDKLDIHNVSPALKVTVCGDGEDGEMRVDWEVWPCPHSTASSNTRPEKHSPKRHSVSQHDHCSHTLSLKSFGRLKKKCYPSSLEHAWYLSITQKMMGYHCWKVRYGSSYLTIEMIGSSPSPKELASEKEPADLNCCFHTEQVNGVLVNQLGNSQPSITGKMTLQNSECLWFTKMLKMSSESGFLNFSFWNHLFSQVLSFFQ